MNVRTILKTHVNGPLRHDDYWLFLPCVFLRQSFHLTTKAMHAAWALVLVVGLVGAADEFGTSNLYPDSQFIDLIARDIESFQGPVGFGNKYITGGAGEGDQKLRPEDDFEHREQVKSDNVLPAYCEPPNPCPVGYSGADGCLEEFENSAEFSRNYQAQQQCLCDQEHMFNCPTKEKDEYENEIDEMVAKNGVHKVMAKKYHEKRSDFEEPRRKKRSAGFAHFKPNPYLQGEPLRSVSKKDGRHL